MDELYVNIRTRREALGMSQDELAKKVGYTSRSSITKIESGKVDIPRSKIEEFAKALGCTPSELLGWTEPELVELWEYDVIGRIAAGYGREPIMEYTGEKTHIPADSLQGYKKDDVFVLSITGSSMHPLLLDKDKVIVRKTNSIESGDIGVVMVGETATVKRIVYHKEGETEPFMDLIPINPEYETVHITGEKLNECRVLGKVISLMRNV